MVLLPETADSHGHCNDCRPRREASSTLSLNNAAYVPVRIGETKPGLSTEVGQAFQPDKNGFPASIRSDVALEVPNYRKRRKCYRKSNSGLIAQEQVNGVRRRLVSFPQPMLPADVDKSQRDELKTPNGILLRPEDQSLVAEHAKQGLGGGGQGFSGRLQDQEPLEFEGM